MWQKIETMKVIFKKWYVKGDVQKFNLNIIWAVMFLKFLHTKIWNMSKTKVLTVCYFLYVICNLALRLIVNTDLHLTHQPTCAKHIYCNNCLNVKGRVWIYALHLSYPVHTQQWVGNTHPVGGSVPCSRVSPQSWYWGWTRALVIHSPHLQSLEVLEPMTIGLQVWLSNH